MLLSELLETLDKAEGLIKPFVWSETGNYIFKAKCENDIWYIYCMYQDSDEFGKKPALIKEGKSFKEACKKFASTIVKQEDKEENRWDLTELLKGPDNEYLKVFKQYVNEITTQMSKTGLARLTKQEWWGQENAFWVDIKNISQLTDFTNIQLPQEIHNLLIRKCPNLKSFNGISSKIEELTLENLNITTFEGLPQIEYLILQNCNFTNFNTLLSNVKRMEIAECTFDTLDGIPQTIENLTIWDSNFTNLSGCPENIKLRISGGTKPHDLTGLPSHMKEFSISNESQTSLHGCPDKFTGNFIVTSSNLIDLTGCPKEISGNFELDVETIKSLKNAPQKINGEVKIYGYQHPNYLDKEDIDNYLKQIGH